jgi:hypothetical protein
MADTGTTRLGIRQPESGQYNNSWGDVLNDDMMQLFDDSITGETTIALGAATTYSLGALVLGVSSESRFMCLKITGAPASAVTITVPASITKKWYLVDNQCGQTVTLKYSASTGVAIATATRFLVWCDGTEVYAISALATNANSLGGVAAANYARLDIANAFLAAQANRFVTVTDAASVAINADLGNNFIVTLSANRTVANPTNPRDGQELNFLIVQDATGGRTLTWSSAWEFLSGAAPTLTATANGADLVKAIYNSALAKWFAYSTRVAIAGSTSVAITQNTLNLRLIDQVGAGAGAIIVNVTIPQGVTIYSIDPGIPALDLSGFDSGSTINVLNLGYILGCGGDGGNGGEVSDNGTGGNSFRVGRPGRAGGDAIKGPGLGRTFNLTNASGFVWGGGGGGGGGGCSSDASADSASGGGGGGGAGGGKGGAGGSIGFTVPVTGFATDGANGTTGSLGANGAGGGGNGQGTGTGGAGGDGGDWGQAGAAGTAPTTHTLDVTGGAAGAAGKAINLNGGAMGTFTGSSAPQIKGAVS